MNDRKEFLKAIALTGGIALLTKTSWGQTPNSQIIQPKIDSIPNPLPAKDLKQFQTNSHEPIALQDKLNPFVQPRNLNDILSSVKRLYTDDVENNTDIGKGYKFLLLNSDTELLYHHVEFLLRTSDDLLQRCLSDRNEWNDKYSKSFQIKSDIKEFFMLDSIHQEEIRAGFYILPYQEAVASYNEEMANNIAASNQVTNLQTLFNNYYADDKFNYYMQIASSLAWLSYQPTHAENNGAFVNYKALDYNLPPPDLAYNLTSRAFALNYHTQQIQILDQLINYQANAAGSSAKLYGLFARLQWEEKDIDFKRRRAEMARSLIFDKLDALVDSGGALNYSEQMDQIQSRFNRDFRDAIARIGIAYKGLDTIYGYPIEIPNSIQDVLSSKPLNSSIVLDEAIVWVRNALSWLEKFSQLEQEYVATVSLKHLMGLTEWNKGKIKGIWQFNLDESFFENQFNVRLRGLTAFINFNEQFSEVFQMNIQSPKDSHYKHKDSNKVADQSKIPPINIGRVSTRQYTYNADVVGITSLHNVSPIGQWIVKLNLNYDPNADINFINDIQLDIHIAVRQYAN